MTSRRFALIACAFLLATVALLGAVDRAIVRKPPAPPGRPRLVVLLVFDQMRGDYLTRWKGQFGEGGLRRLQDEGAWFQNCHYPYAFTVTGAGHASLLTGCTPAVHGIVGNDWYERAIRKTVNCVREARPYGQVPPDPDSKEKDSASPDRLLAPTVGDVLKEATGGRARAVALSLKDRSAVLPGGHRPDGCYWFDSGTGTFVTSTYYRDRLPPWVEEFNQANVADRWFGRAWDRLRPDLDYVKLSGPDDVPGEGTGYKQGRTFPHPMSADLEEPKSKYYDALTTSPFGNDLLVELAKRAIDAEGLGRHDVPDLLSVSFSSNDLIGHVWGPDSQEVFDTTLRTDLVVKDLLAHLDAKVGKGRYLVALTADHGVCPLPEVSRARGEDAGRIPSAPLVKAAGAFLTKTFGGVSSPAAWFEKTSLPWVYLNADAARAAGKTPDEVAEVLAGWVKTQPGIAAAYTRSQMTRGVPAADRIGQMIRQSFHPDRCGDVYVLQKPYSLFSSEFSTGTTHGTPYPYDTHVPLLVYGTGVRAGVSQEPVTPQAIAAIFAARLGIPPPGRSEYPVPHSLKALP